MGLTMSRPSNEEHHTRRRPSTCDNLPQVCMSPLRDTCAVAGGAGRDAVALLEMLTEHHTCVLALRRSRGDSRAIRCRPGGYGGGGGGVSAARIPFCRS